MLTADRLREVVSYDPDTGEFYRKVRLAQRHQVGDRADMVMTTGRLTGYRTVAVDSKRYLAHRCAWLYVYGEWPKSDVDHINGERGDNRIANLRDAGNVINTQNIRTPKKNNKSGYLGVVLHQGKWRASITHHRKTIRLGMFDTPEEAHSAYVRAKRRLHEGCTI